MSSPGARRRCAISANSSRSMSFAVSLQLLERLAAPEHHRHLQGHRRGRREQVAQQHPQTFVAGAEHRAHDHFERDRLHARMDRERAALGPSVELVLGDLAHQRLVRAHPVAVERRQHHLPSRQVLLAFEQQQRPRADQRLERDLAPGRHLVPALAVQRPDHVRARDHHQRRLEALERDLERLAVLAPAVLEEADRPRHPPRRLHGGRLARAGDRGHGPDRSGPHRETGQTLFRYGDFVGAACAANRRT